jgi:catechol 2,3-dioxygenase-like lactoylglutathione lyase family enzyme
MRRRSFICFAAASAGAAALPLVGCGKQTGGSPTGTNKPANHEEAQRSETSHTKEQVMELGAFSVSLAVKDLEASRMFYEKFGFKAFAGNPAQNWQILKNGDHVIGLFQGMIDKNILTFNPGWDQNAQKVATFTDVRELQRQLKAQGVQFMSEADENTTGPASFMALDPDGNTILVDQHV